MRTHSSLPFCSKGLPIIPNSYNYTRLSQYFIKVNYQNSLLAPLVSTPMLPATTPNNNYASLIGTFLLLRTTNFKQSHTITLALPKKLPHV